MQAGPQKSLKVALTAMCCALALGGTAAESAAATRDWNANPAIIQLDTTEDVFAIGDAHGDPQRLAGALAGAKLIEDASAPPDKVKWAGGKSVLVVTGDMIDKGSDSIGVITLLRTLQSDAAAGGGRVIVTMGNHEAEFLAGEMYKTAEFIAELTAAGMKPDDVADCGGDIGQFLCGLPIAVRVNDWFFSHGGNTGNRTMQQISDDIEAGFATDGFATQELVGKNSILEARLNKKGPNGLPWFQDGESSTDPQELLETYVATLCLQHCVNHLVQGHQYNAVKFPDGENRKEEHFFQRYGLLFLIDTGMSRGIEDSDSIGGALRITAADGDPKAIVICPDGTEKTLWSRQKTDREEHLCGE